MVKELACFENTYWCSLPYVSHRMLSGCLHGLLFCGALPKSNNRKQSLH